MSGTNFYTSAYWNENVKISLTDDLDYAKLGSFTGSVPNESGHYATGCVLTNSSTGSSYINTGTVASPNFVPLGGSASLPIVTDFGGGKLAMYDQSTTILGIPISGVFNAYSDNSFLTSFIGTLSGDFTGIGGETNSMICGYQSFTGGAVANTNYSYDDINGTANVRIEASTLTNQVRIELETDGVTDSLSFNFGGSNRYYFPGTTPNPGDVLTAVAPGGLLGWVAGVGGGITIGNSIGGGAANQILYANTSAQLQQSINFRFTDTTDQFVVAHAGSQNLLIDGNVGQFYMGDGGGVGNTTLIEILDGTPLIRNWVNGQFLVQQPNAGASIIDGNTTTFNLYLGDVGHSANGNILEIIDSLGTITAYISSEFQVVDDTASFRFLDVKPSTNNYAIGDLNNFNNFTYFNINDFAMQVFVQTGGDFGVQDIGGRRVIDANMSGGVGNFYIKIGDANGTGNGTLLGVDDSAASIEAQVGTAFVIKNVSGHEFFHADTTGGGASVAIGNLGAGNQTKIIVDDVAQLITLTNVPTFANNAAAIVGGLTTGMLYKTTTGGVTALNILP